MSVAAPPYAPADVARRAAPRPPYVPPPSGVARRAGDRYLGALAAVLLGYALFGRGFAYVGVAPAFIGEIALLAGLLVAARSRALALPLATWPARLLAAFMAWGLLRTLPYIPEYGVDALRDAALWGYGAFAFIVAGLLLRHGDRLRAWITAYRSFAGITLALAGVVFVASRALQAYIPLWPGTEAHLMEMKGGDILVHLAGIAAFLILGMRRMTPLALLALAGTLALVLTSNRGGMVAFAAAMLVVLLMRPPTTRLARPVLAVILLATLVVLINPRFEVPGSNRTISVEQVTDNLRSLVGASDSRTLGTTVEWRLQWWRDIVGYTVDGPHFVGGKGFGVNLALADGVPAPEALRSPHNGHLTVLARAGVAGFLLWAALLGAWFAMAIAGWARARLAKDHAWTAVWAFLTAYALAFLVNATFDVYLEGPMGGIWFWTVFGTGIAAHVVQRRQPGLLHDAPPAQPRPALHPPAAS
jgi:hypothetical protein